ncbi:4642_t:CDS:2 [Ambispora gerdemannii]|uniref:4642_t:CDS:1 n=1 Tax=Ambispora gerdemannii TaxID=144530 RepID=A0A9N9BYF7_9GLOM|nr:4642_t:CDS:2 [Ambispora gerdemannii]
MRTCKIVKFSEKNAVRKKNRTSGPQNVRLWSGEPKDLESLILDYTIIVSTFYRSQAFWTYRIKAFLYFPT